jgi:hypothetical protein
MDPIATLVMALGTLVVLDLAALGLSGERRPRRRPRSARPR